MENTITVKEIKNVTLRKATERITKCTHAIATAEEAEPTEETTDNAALIASAIHDMRAAFNNLCDIISATNGIDEANDEMLTTLISDIINYRF